MFNSTEPDVLILAKTLLNMIEKRSDAKDTDSKHYFWLREQYEKCQKILLQGKINEY